MAVYWPATHHKFVNYDDNLYVVENKHVTGGLTWENARWAFGSGHAANWHPLTWLSHMLDCQLFGVKPWGHHLTNLLLHAANAALVFLLLQRLTGGLWRSLGVAALFAFHPLRVESVAWVAERKDVLSGLFFLLTLWAYANYVSGGESVKTSTDLSSERRSWSWYAVALLFFVLGLMSKPMVVTIPFVMLLLDYWPLLRMQTGEKGRTKGSLVINPKSEIRNPKSEVPRLSLLLVEKIPFFALAALACVVTFAVQKAGGTVGSQPLGFRATNALVSVLRYIEKLFWPANLAVFYPLPEQWAIGLVALDVGLLSAASAVFWMKRRAYPFLLVGWLWFVGTLVPVIGLVQVGQQAMADRYTYLPSIGCSLMLVWGAYELTRRWRYHRNALLIAGSTAAIICVGLTRDQLGYWANSETLFRHALRVTDSNDLAHNNLGAALADKGQLEDAMVEYREAIRLKPYDAEFHYHLGNALGIRGHFDDAIPSLREAISLKPDYPEAHNDLGMALATKGNMNEAIREFQEAIRLKPDYADPHSHLGSALNAEGRSDEAIREFQEALRLNPNYAEVHNKLGLTLSLRGRNEEAILHYGEAIRLQPNYAKARYNLANALAGKGQVDDAIQQLQEAIRLQPNYAEAHNSLGLLLEMKGRTDEAIAHLQEAVRLRPGDAAARKNLENALASRVGFSKQSSAPKSPP